MVVVRATAGQGVNQKKDWSSEENDVFRRREKKKRKGRTQKEPVFRQAPNGKISCELRNYDLKCRHRGHSEMKEAEKLSKALKDQKPRISRNP